MHPASLANIPKQTEIFMGKSLEERFRLGLQMADEGKMLLESGIKMQSPGISNAELRSEIFKHLYSDYFPENELELIASSIRSYHINKFIYL